MTTLFHILKKSEGGVGQKDGMFLLRDHGIKCEPAYSCYVGHSGILVHGSQRIVNKAERILYG